MGETKAELLKIIERLESDKKTLQIVHANSTAEIKDLGQSLEILTLSNNSLKRLVSSLEKKIEALDIANNKLAVELTKRQTIKERIMDYYYKLTGRWK